MLWESVLKSAASSQEYWSRELTEPAFEWKMSARAAEVGKRSGLPQPVDGVVKRQRTGDDKRAGRG
eukprot:431628-Amphidinium_carterae.1